MSNWPKKSRITLLSFYAWKSGESWITSDTGKTRDTWGSRVTWWAHVAYSSRQTFGAGRAHKSFVTFYAFSDRSWRSRGTWLTWISS